MSSEGSARTPGSLIGRRMELDRLLRGLEDALRWQGRLFLIGGEPGIGKSRISDEVANRASAQGLTVLWGKCWEGGGAPAYWPWMQCLRAYFRGQEPDTLRDQLGPGAADIAQMLPEVEALVPELPQLPSVDPESARFRLFDSTATFLRNAADAGGLVVVIDDLHAMDTASLLFLRFLAGQIADMRILLLATYRDVELTPDHPLTTAITDLDREPTTQHVRLGGLAEPDVAMLVERTAGVAPTAGLVSALHRQTDGNPLFIGEAVRMLAAEGRITSVAEATDIRLSIPGAVKEVMLRRLDQLTKACRDTMSIASVLGQDFSAEEVRRLADLSSEEFADVSDEAVTAGLFVEVGGAPSRFRFFHDLVREVLYQEITPGRRSRLHWSAGDVLESLHAPDLGGHLGVIAHHYFEGVSVGDAAKASNYCRRAAEKSSGELAYEEAARLYRMALQATELADAVDPVERGDLLLGLGDAQARSGNLSGARETFLLAFELARRAGVAELAGQAALGYGGRFVWARAGRDQQVVPMLQDALVMLGGDDDRMRVRLLARLACAQRDSPDREHSASLSKQALDLARDLGDPATLAYALEGRIWSIWWPENPTERLQLSAECRQVAAEIHDAERMVQARISSAGALLELGLTQEARDGLETVIRTAEELRQPAQRWLGDAFLALILLFEGRFGPAEDLINATLESDDPTSVRDNVSAARFQLFLLRREQGRVDETERLVRASIEDFPSYPLHRPALVCLLMDVGRKSEAKAIFSELARDDFAALHRDSEWILGTSLAAEACWMLGDETAAAVLYQQLIPFGGRHAIGLAEGSLGALDRYLGLLAQLLGRTDDAEHHLEDAIAMNQRMGARPWVAHCQRDLAGLLLSRDGPGDRDKAMGLLGEALMTAEELGMVVLEAKIGPLLGDEVEQAPADSVAEGVFRREGEYWSVVFDGRGVRLRDAKGMRHLARLMADPGREFHVLDLVRMEEGLAERVDRADLELAADGLGDAGEILDAQAKAAYRQRLAELEEDLGEAEAWNDAERVSRVKEEIEFLTRELAGAVGLSGRDRKAGSAAERARLNVSRAIRAAMGRIAENHPLLGKHLDATVNTGLYCSYTPDPRIPITWRL
ncbi:MAG TPA: AAA family ATPase [Acidimicrobiia bacterium]|nr:AAA family ATPase [Acidimicrobiia bacterium]